MMEPVKFERPPVVEVGCGILFAGQSPLKTVHIGRFWDRIKSDFPRFEDVPPMAAIVENLGSPTANIDWTLGWSDIPQLRRVLFLNEDGSNLIQIQQDKFVFNWKRSLDSVTYPSYVEVSAKFEHYLETYLTFLDEIGLPRPAYRQFEMAYFNLINKSNGLDQFRFDEILIDHTRYTGKDRLLNEPHSVNWVSSYSLPDGAGRLHVASQLSNNTPNDEKSLRLDLFARGIPADTSDAGRKPWFDMAHYWITQGFADVTMDRVQKEIWGRKQ